MTTRLLSTSFVLALMSVAAWHAVGFILAIAFHGMGARF